ATPRWAARTARFRARDAQAVGPAPTRSSAGCTADAGRSSRFNRRCSRRGRAERARSAPGSPTIRHPYPPIWWRIARRDVPGRALREPCASDRHGNRNRRGRRGERARLYRRARARVGAMDPLVIVFGFGVGALVGLTGMGGGSLMTPILIIVFGY